MGVSAAAAVPAGFGPGFAARSAWYALASGDPLAGSYLARTSVTDAGALGVVVLLPMVKFGLYGVFATAVPGAGALLGKRSCSCITGGPLGARWFT